MSKIMNLFKVNLQLFNDGGAVGAEGSTAVTENTQTVENKQNGSNRRSKSGAFKNVVFGKQEGTTADEPTSLDTEGKTAKADNKDGESTSSTLEERRKAYNDLINGEYKDLDQERFQQVFDRRFKQVKGIEKELTAQKPIIDMLMSRYGVDSVDNLEKALNEDTEYWESVAEEHGMTVEQYHAMQKLERENAELKAMRERQFGQAQFQQQIDSWYKEATKVKDIYPSFDFKKECENTHFINMLKRGIGVEHAYKLIHFDELTENAARDAAQIADAQAQARIKSKSSRPSENGISSQSAVVVKSDVSKLTKAERAEIARRVKNGEIIKF